VRVRTTDHRRPRFGRGVGPTGEDTNPGAATGGPSRGSLCGYQATSRADEAYAIRVLDALGGAAYERPHATVPAWRECSTTGRDAAGELIDERVGPTAGIIVSEEWMAPVRKDVVGRVRTDHVQGQSLDAAAGDTAGSDASGVAGQDSS
jgi:hypothetical protein